jgi:hypothetical protein
VLLNSGDGSFADATDFDAGAKFSGSKGVGAGDLDGDQDLDIAVANPGAGAAFVLLNRGDASFEAGRSFPTRQGGQSIATGFANPLALADLDADLDLDLAVLDFQESGTELVVFFNATSPPFSEDTDKNGIPDKCPPPGRAFIRGDCNGDGEVIGTVTDAVYVLSFNFLGGPPPAAPFPACGPGGGRDERLGCEMEQAACR